MYLLQALDLHVSSRSLFLVLILLFHWRHFTFNVWITATWPLTIAWTKSNHCYFVESKIQIKKRISISFTLTISQFSSWFTRRNTCWAAVDVFKIMTDFRSVAAWVFMELSKQTNHSLKPKHASDFDAKVNEQYNNRDKICCHRIWCNTYWKKMTKSTCP